MKATSIEFYLFHLSSGQLITTWRGAHLVGRGEGYCSWNCWRPRGLEEQAEVQEMWRWTAEKILNTILKIQNNCYACEYLHYRFSLTSNKTLHM